MPVGAAGGSGGCPLAEGAFPESNASFWATILFPIPSISPFQKQLFPNVVYGQPGQQHLAPSASDFDANKVEGKSKSLLQRSLDRIIDEAIKTKNTYPVQFDYCTYSQALFR